MTAYQKKLEELDFLRVVCVGDVVTSQELSRPSWSDWLQRAFWEITEPQKAWRRQVINTGFSKATPRHVATYLTHYVTQFKPDVVILSFGVMPLFPVYEEPTFLGELDMLLDAIKKANIELILWSPYPLSGGISRDGSLSLERIYRQKAEELGATYVDIFHEFENIELSRVFTYSAPASNELFGLHEGNVDHIHLNKIGQYIIAKRIIEEAFRIGLPISSSGEFEVPNVSLVKRW